VEKGLGNTAFYVEGIGKLFANYGIAGYQEPLAALKAQIDAYNDFVRGEVLPRARSDFGCRRAGCRSLRRRGIDMPRPACRTARAPPFTEIRNEIARWLRWWPGRRGSRTPTIASFSAP
jgi:hypothetical protein